MRDIWQLVSHLDAPNSPMCRSLQKGPPLKTRDGQGLPLAFFVCLGSPLLAAEHFKVTLLGQTRGREAYIYQQFIRKCLKLSLRVALSNCCCCFIFYATLQQYGLANCFLKCHGTYYSLSSVILLAMSTRQLS